MYALKLLSAERFGVSVHTPRFTLKIRLSDAPDARANVRRSNAGIV
jgi:hypothetical protein